MKIKKFIHLVVSLYLEDTLIGKIAFQNVDDLKEFSDNFRHLNKKSSNKNWGYTVHEWETEFGQVH